MFDPSRHYPLKISSGNWNWFNKPSRILRTTRSRNLSRAATPSDPLDDFGGSGLYTGMTGVIWALTYLNRVQAIAADRDFTTLLEEQLSANEKESKGMPHPENASYLFGELPILMLQFKFSRDRRIADQIFQSIAKNNTQPIRELMWGSAGSMLCANLFAHVDLRRSMAGGLLTASEEAVEGVGEN